VRVHVLFIIYTDVNIPPLALQMLVYDITNRERYACPLVPEGWISHNNNDHEYNEALRTCSTGDSRSPSMRQRSTLSC
jgi:hypothetical protein